MNLATRFVRPALVLLLLATTIFVHPSLCLAQRNRDASIGFILKDAGAVPRCSDLRPIACSDQTAKVTGGLQDYYAILCVFNGDDELGIAGMEFGIDYDSGNQSGVDVTSWNLCADLEWMDDTWPDAGSGGIITWTNVENCQKTVPGDALDGVTAIAGFFTITAYSTDRLRVVTHDKANNQKVLAVADCSSSESALDPTQQAGYLGFSSDLSEKGSIPCVHHVGKTTWGVIKSTYGH
jgi:hypothetical protein